jgi:hypothetical protein
VKELLPEDLKARFGATPRVPLRDERRALRYPVALPEPDPGGPRPNVLVVVIDSWRADMLDPEVTPRLSEFASDARVFENHLSGGNATRFGLFSLLYGLHGTYWWSALEARQPSVLTSVLEREGYDLRVYSSASMEYPEFRSTAWVDVPECVEDDFPQIRQSVRDEVIVERCREVWRQRRASGDSAPFFNFVLLDSAHQTYDFPADSAPFEPYAEDLDYLAMAASRDPGLARLVRHRYQNALHHADRVAARLIDDLRAAGELDDTLVVVTGDHGEEFVEHGYWGHTGNFTAEQAAVPFLMRGPGVENGRETRPTSHVDFVPTLFRLLGADPARRGDYCVGLDLLDLPQSRNRAVSGWEDLGLWTDSGIIRLPQDLQDRHLTGVFNHDWELMPAPEAAYALEARALERLSEECTRFLAPLPELVARRLR